MKSMIRSIPFVTLAIGLSSACSVVSNSMVTFYGYPDNSPPGAGTAYDCGGRNYVAGGTGTYDDPLTFATASGEFEQCEIVYLPLLKKYLRYEDECAQCGSDWSNGQYHIDIWTGSNSQNGGDTQVDCENSLTSGGNYDVIRQPGEDYEVESGKLFDASDDSCHPEYTYESNKASSYCSGGNSYEGESVSGSSSNASSSTVVTTTPVLSRPTDASTSSVSSTISSDTPAATAAPARPHRQHRPHGQDKGAANATLSYSAPQTSSTAGGEGDETCD